MATTKYFEVEIEVKVTPVNGSSSPKKGNSLKGDKGKTISFKKHFRK